MSRFAAQRARRASAAPRCMALFLGVGLTVCLAACGRPEVRVLLVGDSITAGLVSGPTASDGPAYPELLADQLGPGYAVERAACPGSTALDWRPSSRSVACAGEWQEPNLYEALAAPHLPADFAVLLLGTNDASGGRRGDSTPEEYEAALREIVARLRADGADRVVLVTPPPAYKRTRHYRRLHEFRHRLHALCEGDPHVVCGPDLFVTMTYEDFHRRDVHPNAAGHARIARALAETLSAEASR